MTTEEAIKAAIREAIRLEEAGLAASTPRDTSLPTKQNRRVLLDQAPILVVVQPGGSVTPAIRLTRTFAPHVHREVTEEENERLPKEWDAAIKEAETLKRSDLAIVLHYDGAARVELRKGPAFDPPEG